MNALVTYGLPVIAGLLAVAGYLYARRSAAEFDRRFALTFLPANNGREERASNAGALGPRYGMLAPFCRIVSAYQPKLSLAVRLRSRGSVSSRFTYTRP